MIDQFFGKLKITVLLLLFGQNPRSIFALQSHMAMENVPKVLNMLFHLKYFGCLYQ